MKILILSWKDITHPEKGGAEVVIWSYCKELFALGHEVTWLGSGYGGAHEHDEKEGIKLIRVGGIYSIYAKIGLYYKRNLSAQYDIVIDEAGGPPMLSPLFVKDIPIVFLINHISDIEWKQKFPFPLSYIGRQLYNQTLKLYKNRSTITVSDSTQDELIHDFGFTKNRIHVLENALDLLPDSSCLIEKKEDSILFFGRLMPLKRVEDAIHAFSILQKKHSHYILNIIGPFQAGDYVDSLKGLVSDLGITKNVIFHGKISLEERYKIARNKLMLVPSYKEGYGLVVLEGNAFGIPSIGYDVAGIRDSIKNGINGYKVPDGDKDLLGEKLVELIEDKEKLIELSQSSFHHLEQHPSWTENTKKLLQVLEDNIKK